MASVVKRGNGSETATGETPVSSGRPRSCIVYTLDGEVNLICFWGLKFSVLWTIGAAPWMTGSKVGLTALSGAMSATVAMIMGWLRFGRQEEESLSTREEWNQVVKKDRLELRYGG